MAPRRAPTDPVVAHAKAVIEGASRSFSRAAALLPKPEREGAYLLYAWCRHCDDLIDGQTLGRPRSPPAPNPAPASREVAAGPGPAGSAGGAAAILAELRRATRHALDGGPPSLPVYEGIARVVRDHGVPERHPFEFLDGMAMDVEGRTYRTFDELVAYCHRVGGVVAIMTAHVMGHHDPAPLQLADDAGIAFQLTNIARDVMDDAAIGRVYLPLDWLARAGVPADAIARPEHRPAVAQVVHRLLERADGLYQRAARSTGPLPFRSAWAIAAALGMYADIGRVIRRRGARAWDRRAFVSDARKAWWVARGLGVALVRARSRLAEPIRAR